MRNANRIKLIGMINNDIINIIAHCVISNGANCKNAPPNDTHATVHATTPHATKINIGLVFRRLNILYPSVRTQKPFTIAIITNNANLADIYAPGAVKYC